MALKYGYANARFGQLPSSSQATGARTNHRNLRRTRRRFRQGLRTARCPLMIGNGALVVTDGGRALDGGKVASSLAQRRAYTARELRERIGERQSFGRFVPQTAIHQIIPFRNKVVQRAARRARLAETVASLAKRHTAHHATARLDLLLLFGKWQGEFLEVFNGLQRRTFTMSNAIVLEICSCFAHYWRPFPTISYASSSASSWLLPSASAAATICRTRSYSTGITFTKCCFIASKRYSILMPRGLCV